MRNMFLIIIASVFILVLTFALYNISRNAGDYFVLLAPVPLGAMSALIIKNIALGRIALYLASGLLASLLSYFYWFYVVFVRLKLLDLMHPLDTGHLFSVYIFTGIFHSLIWGCIFGFLFRRLSKQ